MADERDNVGMVEQEDGSYALLVKMHEAEQSPSATQGLLTDILDALNAILAKLNTGIKVQTVPTL